MDDQQPHTIHLFSHSIDLSKTTKQNNYVNLTSTSSSSSSSNDDKNAINNNTNQQNETYDEKLIEISNQLANNSVQSSTPSSAILSNLIVESAHIAQQHIAFLLNDGRVCRISYEYVDKNEKNESSESTSSSKNDSNVANTNNNNISSSPSIKNSKHPKLSSANESLSSTNFSSNLYRAQPSRTLGSASFASSIGSQPSGGTTGSTTTSKSPSEAFIMPSSHDLLASSSLSHTFGRGRKNQILRGRVSSLIVGSTRMPSFLPASAVPESLIENVQTVLQSKSRSVIIRELQRTNLDVNLAVNNLLQRDDEGDDPTDDEESYMHGDDLISLLDINSNHGDNILLEADGSVLEEEAFRLNRRFANRIAASVSSSSSSSNQPAASTTGNNQSSSPSAEQNERDSRKNSSSSYRLKDHRWYDSYKDDSPSGGSSSSSSYRDLFSSNTLTNRNETVTKESSSSSNTTNSSSSTDSNKKENSKNNQKLSNIIFGQNLQYWIETNGETPKFVKMAGMYSELVCVSQYGKLHQWKWSSDVPYSETIHFDSIDSKLTSITIYHPKTLWLELLNEKVCGISTSQIRASVWTESSKIASWLDESLDIPYTYKYQTQAQLFTGDDLTKSDQPLQSPVLINPDRILDMTTSNLFTLIRTYSGSLFWWGVMSYEYRAKLYDKYQAKLQKYKLANNEIAVGNYVSLKSLPVYNIGTIGFTVKDGVPLIGELNEQVFGYRDYTKAYKFKLRSLDSFGKDLMQISQHNFNDLLEQQSEFSSPYQTTTPHGSLKRKKSYSTIDNLTLMTTCNNKKISNKNEIVEDTWMLSDVIFVEETKSSNVLGKVIKIDADYVLVKMQSSKESDTTKNNDSSSAAISDSSLLDNCRIFQKNQIQLVRQSSSSSSSKSTPDFIQPTPKRVQFVGNSITITAQNYGFNALIIKESALFYMEYDFFAGKILKEKRLPTTIPSFLGNNLNNIKLFSLDETNLKLISLLDGNSTLFPLVDLPGSTLIKEPQWKNLFPLKCFHQCLLKPKPGSNKLNILTLMTMQKQLLTKSILNSNLEGVNKILSDLDLDIKLNGINNSKYLKMLADERCDGNRNIIHAAVYASAPTSNATTPETTTTNTILTKTLNRQESISDIYAAYGSSTSSILKSTMESKPWSILSMHNTANKSKVDSSPSASSSSSDESTSIFSKINASLDQANKNIIQDQLNNNNDSNDNKGNDVKESTNNNEKVSTVQDSLSNNNNSNNNSNLANQLTDKEKKYNSIQILKLLLNSSIFATSIECMDNSRKFLNYLNELLTHKNSDGATPFMYAVNLRAYEAAIAILDCALSIRDKLTKLNNVKSYDIDSLFTNMIFPIGSKSDQSPLYVLCSNDTCSFTWTGENHITQDIFECKTCTLVGNLCCCSECARICHKGHDCKIKTSSPTAYCDCWEKCKCKSLIAGDQEKRYQLLDKLLSFTNLIDATTVNGESLLLYLVQTLGRQVQEQKNFKRHCGSMSSSSRRNMSNSNNNDNNSGSNVINYVNMTNEIGEMPQHDLDPPKFCRRALDRIFSDWHSFKAMFLFNTSNINSNTNSNNNNIIDDHFYVESQSGCTDLDKFVYSLLIKCPHELLVTLVETINSRLDKCNSSSLQSNSNNELVNMKYEAVQLIKRFVRSIVRIMVIICMETPAQNLQLNLNLSNGLTNELTYNINTLASHLKSSSNNNIPSSSSLGSKLHIRFKSSSATTTNSNQSTTTSSTLTSLVTVPPLVRCEFVLRHFAKYSLEELADTAQSLIAPVVLGITKPMTFKASHLISAMNSTSSSGSDFSAHGINNNNTNNNKLPLAEDLFNIEPNLNRKLTTLITTHLITNSAFNKEEALINKNQIEQIIIESMDTSTTKIKENNNITTDIINKIVRNVSTSGDDSTTSTNSNDSNILISSKRKIDSSTSIKTAADSKNTTSNNNKKKKVNLDILQPMTTKSSNDNILLNDVVEEEVEEEHFDDLDDDDDEDDYDDDDFDEEDYEDEEDEDEEDDEDEDDEDIDEDNEDDQDDQDDDYFYKKEIKIKKSIARLNKLASVATTATTSSGTSGGTEPKKSDSDHSNKKPKSNQDKNDKNLTSSSRTNNNNLTQRSGNRPNTSAAVAQLASITNFIQQYSNNSTSSSTSQSPSTNPPQSFSNLISHHLLNEQFSGSSSVVSLPFLNTTALISNASNLLPVSNTNMNLSNQYLENGSSLLNNSSNSSNNNNNTNNSVASIQITNNSLARIFSILIKLIRELLNYVSNFNNEIKDDPEQTKIRRKKLRKLIDRINLKLESPWQWLVSIMDATEAQLRFGATMNSTSNMQNALDSSDNQTQYLRHLEERALLSNYYNNNGATITTSHHSNLIGNTTITTTGVSASTASNTNSSRFGSGIDARRKLNIMQHQHLQYVNNNTNLNNIINPSFNFSLINTPLTTTTSSNSNLNNRSTSTTTNNSNVTSVAASTTAATSTTNLSDNSISNNSIPNLAAQLLSSQIISTRREFLSYSLSLMRSYTNEHRDFMPSIDISLLKHVAHVFDGLMFYLRSKKPNNVFKQAFELKTDSSTDCDSSDEDNSSLSSSSDLEDGLNNGRRLQCTRQSTFFKRGDSTLCLGGQPTDPFGCSLEDALPLVLKPHLLQPHARVQDMFRCRSQIQNKCNVLNRTGIMLSGSRPGAPILYDRKLTSKLAKLNENINSLINNNENEDCLIATSKMTSLNSNNDNSKFLDRMLSSLVKILNDEEKETNNNDTTLNNLITSVMFQSDQIIDRWRLTVDLFGRVFCDDVGLEPGSVIRNLGGFQLKEVKFRKEMERLRNISSRELMMEVDRDRNLLISMSIKSLNNMYNTQCNRRGGGASSSSSGNLLPPPLCLSRVKVTFKDEQGEGSGVARSFYTAFSEAILADLNLPILENTNNISNQSTSSSSSANSLYVPFSMQRYRSRASSNHHDFSRRDNHHHHHQSSSQSPTAASIQTLNAIQSVINPRISIPPSLSTTSIINRIRINESVAAAAAVASTTAAASTNSANDTNSSNSNNTNRSSPTTEDSSSTFISTINVQLASSLLNNNNNNNNSTSTASTNNNNNNNNNQNTGSANSKSTTPTEPQQLTNDNTPLFWQPNKKMPGFYSPRPGKNSTIRLNAFRNVGRIIGVCLLQNELCPIVLSRHCIKYILNRPIKWHDLAFFDAEMYESFRKMINDTEKYLLDSIRKARVSQSKLGSKSAMKMALQKAMNDVDEKIFKPLELTFNIDLPNEEGGCNVDLIENGSTIEVNCSNMYEFVKRYSKFRMLDNVEKCLEQLKAGVFDVLPANALDGITPEDFRLLLNGVADININILASYTSISDESKENNRRAQFEKWFWGTLDKMSLQEKQELLFFWTGSPYLPASEEGFQPLPTITLRPPSDQHLPTANTCINRLYIPVYSSKSILKLKLLQAIKTKTFGFV